MTQAFLTVLDMSLSAGYVIAVVFLLRWFWGLVHLPKRFSYILWAFVLIRLLVPSIPESNLSRLPDDLPTPIETVGASIARPQTTDIPVITDTPTVSSEPTIETTAQPDLTPALTHVWLTGMGLMLAYNLLSLLRLRRRLAEAIHIGGRVYLSDHIDTAFVMGLLRPRIYLPAHLTEAEQTFILAHERQHIRRKDHLVKLLAFGSLTLHWFNPLVWAAFRAAMKDMELSCDEAVTGDMDGDTRADYAHTLLRLTAGQRHFSIAPVAFGEGDVGQRIRHIFAYRKPAALVTAVVLVLLALLIPALLTNPAEKTGSFGTSIYREHPGGFTYEDPNLQSYYEGPFMLTTNGQFLRFHDMGGWINCGYAADYALTADEMTYMMRYRYVYKNPVPVTDILDSRLVQYQEDDNGLHMFFLLTLHADGQRYISYGSCLNDGYRYEDMYIHKVYDVTPELSESSNNGTFYAQCISQYTHTTADTYATHHLGDGVQLVAYTAEQNGEAYIGWMTFRIANGIAEDLQLGHHFAADDNTGGVYFSHLRPEVEGVEYDVILVNNPLLASATVSLGETDIRTYALSAPDLLVIPRTGGERSVHFYTTDGVLFDADGAVISAFSTPEPTTASQLVQVEGYLYYNTGIVCDTDGQPKAGTINSTVAEGAIPTMDNQSNFGADYSYRWYRHPYYLEVGIDGTIYRFQQIEPDNAYGIELDGGGFDGKTLTIYCTRSGDTTQRIAAPDSFTLIDMDSGAILSHVPIETDGYVELGKTYTWTADLSHLSHLLTSGSYRAELRFTFPNGDSEPFYAWQDFALP